MITLPLPIQIFVLLFSVVLHEYSHGWMAEKSGDDTARLMGRLTLNPLPHLDPIGSVVFPLLLFLSRSPFLFAWAKPVPINPTRFNHPRRDIIRVSLAGCGANFFLALLSGIILRFIPRSSEFTILLSEALQFMLYLNLVLAIFNLIPIPPLDGSRVVSALLPTSVAYKYETLTPYGFLIIIFLFWSGFLGSIIWPVVIFFHRLLLTAF